MNEDETMAGEKGIRGVKGLRGDPGPLIPQPPLPCILGCGRPSSPNGICNECLAEAEASHRRPKPIA